MPSIFITGGSGYIGSTIISLTLSRSYTITALSRSPISDTHLLSLGATPVRGDLTSHALLTACASAADVVISLADAAAGNYGISPAERVRINSAALAALAAGLKGSGKSLVTTSGSLIVAADPEGGETNEMSPYWDDEPFGGSGVEDAALGFVAEGIRVGVVRLAPWVYGRGGSGVKIFMAGGAQAGEVVYLGDGAKRTTSCHVEDAARLYLLVAERGAIGGVYNATAETDVTFRQLAEAMAKTLGVPVRAQSYEDTVAKVGSFFAKFLSLENRASSKKARTELGWTIDAKKGLLEEVANGSYVELAAELKKAKA